MVVMIREGSSEKNLETLLPLVNGRNTGRLMFASDDLDPSDMAKRGHINHLLSRAVSLGIDPVTAIQMATLSPASYFGILHRVGAIYAGAQADLVIAPNLTEFMPDLVMHRGNIVFENGQMHETQVDDMPHLRPTMNVKLPKIDDLRILAASGDKFRVIELVPGQILTRQTICEAVIKDGEAVASPEHDLLKVCVFDRHRGSGSFGMGFVRGYGMKRGAVGSSVGHDSHNMVIVGTNDADILKCAGLIRDLGGGQAGVCGDAYAALPLPVAGLMSDKTAEDVIQLEAELDKFCAETLGVTLERPFAALSFMSLPVIPEMRITDQGLFQLEPGGYPQKVALFASQCT
jgi:adenine deaminase